MKRWMMAALLAGICLFSPFGAGAQETDAEIARIADELHDALAGDQGTTSTLNMESPFAPVEMAARPLTQEERATLIRMGINEAAAQDLTEQNPQTWSDTDSTGRTITVLFYGAYGETALVFETRTDGRTYLLDVLYGTNDNAAQAEIVELAGGRYLLTNGWAHGTGIYRGWTNWYHLDTRRMDLRTLREGYENLYPVFAQAVTTTNVDDALDVSALDRTEYLVTRTYTTVFTMENDALAERSLLDDDCAVRVYRSTDGALKLIGERVFDDYTAALLELMSPQELLEEPWLLNRPGEILDTASAAEPVRDEILAAMAQALPRARIANADWVNLREAGDKTSPSLAQIAAGETVYVLSEGNGFENGWTQVAYLPRNGEPVMGYIWWSFLES